MCILDVLKHEACVSTDLMFVSKVDVLEWALKRDVKVKRLVCNSQACEEKLAEFFRRHEKSTTELFMPVTNVHLEECRSLSHLTCMMSPRNCTLICNNHNLQVLSVLGSLDDAYCTSLSVKLPKLHKLKVISSFPSSASALWRNCLLSVIEMAPILQELHLVMCEEIETHVWQAIAQLCPQLRKLGLLWVLVSDEAVIEFARLCPHITSLGIDSNDILTDAGAGHGA